MLQIHLTSVQTGLTDAWRRHCSDFDFVHIEPRSIFEVDADAWVSPANSFGFMDGGIDLHYSEYFGWSLQDRVQAAIRSRHAGELPVGVAELVATAHARIPYLLVAPTMRVPQALMNSANPYLAARAALLKWRDGVFSDGPHQGQPIRAHRQRIAFPGLGTGIGEVSADVCARQMRAAILNVLVRDDAFPRSWIQAQEWHYELIRP